MKLASRVACVVIPAVVAACMVPAASAERTSSIPPRRALAMTVPELNVDNVPMQKVIGYLRDTSGTNIYVNWKSLEAANVNKDTPVSLTVSHLSLHKMLRLVLDQAAPSAALVYVVDEGVIEVMTQDDADRRMITRVYIVDDLVMQPNRNIQVPQLGLGTSQTVSGSGGGVGMSNSGQGLFGGSGTSGSSSVPDTTAETEKAGQDLVKLIMDTIRPTIWKENGGNASIKYFQGKLVVTAPISVQEAIGGPVPDSTRRFGF